MADPVIPKPGDIEVSTGYRLDNLGTPPRDKEVPWKKRGRASRHVSLLATTAAAALIPILTMQQLGSALSFPTFGLWLGLGGAAVTVPLALKYGLYWNPQQVGLVSQNSLSGDVIPYGPGIHPRFPWEVASETDNIPLQTIEHVFTVEVPTTTALVKLEILLMWRPDLENLDHFTNVKDDESVINNGFESFLDSSLTHRLTRQSAAYVRGMTNRINVLLSDEFMGEKKADGKSPTDFETDLGIEIVAIRLRKMIFPSDVQRTLDAGDEAVVMQDMIAGWLGLTPDELKAALREGRVTAEQFAQHMQQAMIISGNASFNVNRIDIPGLIGNIIRR